jgi:hypothetical protein
MPSSRRPPTRLHTHELFWFSKSRRKFVSLEILEYLSGKRFRSILMRMPSSDPWTAVPPGTHRSRPLSRSSLSTQLIGQASSYDEFIAYSSSSRWDDNIGMELVVDAAINNGVPRCGAPGKVDHQRMRSQGHANSRFGQGEEDWDIYSPQALCTR